MQPSNGQLLDHCSRWTALDGDAGRRSVVMRWGNTRAFLRLPSLLDAISKGAYKLLPLELSFSVMQEKGRRNE